MPAGRESVKAVWIHYLRFFIGGRICERKGDFQALHIACQDHELPVE
jgi:hypothetical protein